MPRVKKTTTTKSKTLSPISQIDKINAEIAKKQDEIKKLKAEKKTIEKKMASAEAIELQALLKKNKKTVADVKKVMKLK